MHLKEAEQRERGKEEPAGHVVKQGTSQKTAGTREAEKETNDPRGEQKEREVLTQGKT